MIAWLWQRFRGLWAGKDERSQFERIWDEMVSAELLRDVDAPFVVGVQETERSCTIEFECVSRATLSAIGRYMRYVVAPRGYEFTLSYGHLCMWEAPKTQRDGGYDLLLAGMKLRADKRRAGT